MIFKSKVEKHLERLSTDLMTIRSNIYRIDEEIEAIMKYSYQYNVKILGIPQHDKRESATESAEICLNMFNKTGVKSVSISDIDIAHRIPNRRPSNFSPAIVCKFTRRLAKETVMKYKKEASKISITDITGHKQNAGPERNSYIRIFDHLTPRTQEILREAKKFQKENDFKYCWTKNSEVYLKKEDDSKTVKVTNIDDLERLKYEDYDE